MHVITVIKGIMFPFEMHFIQNAPDNYAVYCNFIITHVLIQ